MSWTEESLLAAFPRANMQYYIQFIEEPKVVEKQGKWGSWRELTVSLQFFAIDEAGMEYLCRTDYAKHFHYMGSRTATLKACALEELTCFGPDIVTRLIHVKGYEHGRHIDLELIDSWDRISASAAMQRDAPEQEGPSKPAVLESSGTMAQPPEHSERGQPQAGGDAGMIGITSSEPPASCSHSGEIKLVPGLGHVPKGFYCQDCGERVG